MSVAPVTEKQAALEMSSIKEDPAFMGMLKRLSEFKTQTPGIKVKTPEDQALAVQGVGAIKSLSKELEAFRVDKVAFPNQYVKSVNGLIKPLREDLMKYESMIMGQVAKFKRAEEEKARAARRKEQVRLDKERAKAQAAEDERRKKEQERLDAEHKAKVEAA